MTSTLFPAGTFYLLLTLGCLGLAPWNLEITEYSSRSGVYRRKDISVPDLNGPDDFESTGKTQHNQDNIHNERTCFNKTRIVKSLFS